MPRSDSSNAVESFLMGQIEKRDQEIAELKGEVIRLQCLVLRMAPQKNSSTVGYDKGRTSGVSLSPTLSVKPSPSNASTASQESTYGSEADPCKIRIQSPSPPNQESLPYKLSRFETMLLDFVPISERLCEYVGDCNGLFETCVLLSSRIFRFCSQDLQTYIGSYTLEAGCSNESAYEILDECLKRRLKKQPNQKSKKSVKQSRRREREGRLVQLHAFMVTKLRFSLNTLSYNVNTPGDRFSFVDGPVGFYPTKNPLISERGLNIEIVSTLHSSTPPADYAASLKWLTEGAHQNTRVRMFYPRGAVPHTRALMEAVRHLGIQPSALVMDVCLVRPKWFPNIDYMQDYSNLIIIPEIPAKDALDEGEAQRIRDKFNKYLQSFSTAGHCVYVVLDRDIAPEVVKEIRINKANVLSLPLPEKVGPIGLREYPLLEMLTVLDSVFDDGFTLNVPEERESFSSSNGKFSPAPGAGGVYKYGQSQAFTFVPSNSLKHSVDPDISDSSSVGSHGSGRRGSGGSTGIDHFFKSLSTSDSRTRNKSTSSSSSTDPPPQHPFAGGFDQMISSLGVNPFNAFSAIASGRVPHSVLSAARPEESAHGLQNNTTQKIAEEDGFTLSVTTDDPNSFLSSGGGLQNDTTQKIAEEDGFTLSITTDPIDQSGEDTSPVAVETVQPADVEGEAVGMALTPAEQKTTMKIAEEDGFTLSITTDPDGGFTK